MFDDSGLAGDGASGCKRAVRCAYDARTMRVRCAYDARTMCANVRRTPAIVFAVLLSASAIHHTGAHNACLCCMLLRLPAV